MTHDNGNTFLALLVGAAIGAGVGILYAPEKGVKTRRMIKDKAKQTSEDIAHRISHAKDELTKTFESKKVDFEQQLDDTISAMSYKADDIISTLEKKLSDLKSKNAQMQK